MGKAKRSRKIKSANKLLKKQRVACQAMANVQMATIAAGCSAAFACVEAAKYSKAGMKDNALAKLGEAEHIVTDFNREKAKFNQTRIVDDNNLHILKEIIDGRRVVDG